MTEIETILSVEDVAQMYWALEVHAKLGGTVS